jgi:hypothetical protein
MAAAGTGWPVSRDGGLAQAGAERDLVAGCEFLVRVEDRGRQLVQPGRDLARQAAVAFRQHQQALDQVLVPLVGAQQLVPEPFQVLARVRGVVLIAAGLPRPAARRRPACIPEAIEARPASSAAVS